MHVNAEFADQASDHDPPVARLTLNDAPTVSAGGPYSVAEGGTVTLTATGNDPEDGALTYAWDLDGNGTFETTGQSVSFTAGRRSRLADGRRAGDGSGRPERTDPATVTVTNVAADGDLDAPATVGRPFTLSLTSPPTLPRRTPPAGFTYAFDCGDGCRLTASSSSRSCPTRHGHAHGPRPRSRTRTGASRRTPRTVQVTATFASLCDLTRTLVSKADVAQSLCDKLVAAATADAAGDTKKRENILGAYRNQVDAQTGKSITTANAALLKQLSLEL